MISKKEKIHYIEGQIKLAKYDIATIGWKLKNPSLFNKDTLDDLWLERELAKARLGYLEGLLVIWQDYWRSNCGSSNVISLKGFKE